MKHTLQLRRNAQQLRKHMTKEERHLWYDYLKTYPIQFKRQCPFGNYIVDFYCDRARLVLELDGSQHCEPEAIACDQARTAYLHRQGLYVLRISNLDVMRNFPGVCEAIHLTVQARIKAFPWGKVPQSADWGG